ncbi:vesicle transport v-snare protein vti1 [Rhizoctonia solani AG-1 IA]|uniref:Vesicle transport v-snare protein vti1 n=1 Tax=Thanatephorus cucumeris (strain AG1-IA) TaxID=983506 RepID=L8WV73_THACA|nr:vesicle transport v-snare protein vti1 [Rhizoctonia solani AG-1 IA]
MYDIMSEEFLGVDVSQISNVFAPVFGSAFGEMVVSVVPVRHRSITVALPRFLHRRRPLPLRSPDLFIDFTMDNSPTALFDSYAQDFQQLINSVREKLEAPTTNGEQRKAALRRVEMELDEADEMISQMEVEIQSMPQSLRGTYNTRVRGLKTELARWKKSADLHIQSSRTELFNNATSGADDPYGDDATNQRTRLLAGTQSLADSSRRLEDSHRIALETEDVGADILRSLRVQREQIEHTRDTLGGADRSIDRASGTLKQMITRMYRQRYITWAIIAILVILIVLILWFKLS